MLPRLNWRTACSRAVFIAVLASAVAVQASKVFDKADEEGLAHLSKALVAHANLSKANLQSANLSMANLPGADMSETNLIRANLEEADLDGADLSRAILSFANMAKASLTGAILRGADLSEVDLGREELLSARDWRGAKLPSTMRNLELADDAGEEELDRLGRTWKPQGGFLLD